jgi:hypothetical protein
MKRKIMPSLIRKTGVERNLKKKLEAVPGKQSIDLQKGQQCVKRNTIEKVLWSKIRSLGGS